MRGTVVDQLNGKVVKNWSSRPEQQYAPIDSCSRVSTAMAHRLLPSRPREREAGLSDRRQDYEPGMKNPRANRFRLMFPTTDKPGARQHRHGNRHVKNNLDKAANM